MASDEIIVGIDLGTTFSLVAYVDRDGPHVIPDARGETRLPSVVAMAHGVDGQVRMSVGWEARDHVVEHPQTTVYSVKRLIGRSFQEVQSELPFLTYAVRAGPRETVRVEIEGRLYSPEEISAAILRELRDRAATRLGRPVRRAVITVPAYFDDAQRQATRDAGEAAGLEVVRIINEPTAAALAYGIGLHARRGGGPAGSGEGQTVAVYDLGGGTFDVSVLRIEDGVYQVLSTAGDTHLGGDDLDRTLVHLVTREVQERFGLAIQAPATQQALRLLAEAVKIRLSTAERAELELDLGAGRIYRRTIERGEFERLIDPLVSRSLALCRQALEDARVDAGQVHRCILVGGSTRIPLVRRRVEELFGSPPYTALDPDEVVATGAAIQGAILAGAELDTLLLDVIPLSLGIETLGGAMGKLILRNTTIPCRATEMFTTFVDGQTAIRFHVLQGERELAADCRSLAQFELRGIPPMPAGIPRVEVEFLVDENGILSVTAREQRSGRQAGVQVVPNRGLTREEVERMARESIAHAREDIAAHRRIDLLNQIEFDIHKTEQMLARHGQRLDPAQRLRIEEQMRALRELARTSVDLDALHQAQDEFARSTLPLAEIGITEALKGSDPRELAGSAAPAGHGPDEPSGDADALPRAASPAGE